MTDEPVSMSGGRRAGACLDGRDAAGALAANLVHFTRLLRRAGLPLGPGASLDAVRAVETVGVAREEDVYWALRAVLVRSAEGREVFDRAFHLFWRDPARPGADLASLLPAAPGPGSRSALAPPAARRVGATRRSGPGSAGLRAGPWGVEVADGADPGGARRPDDTPTAGDATGTWSDRETLRTRDFERMSAEEERLARRLVAEMRVDLPRLVARRWRADPRGPRVDPRATFRAQLRSGHGVVAVRRRRRARRVPDVVFLLDVSGSMRRYARVLLHFAHALTRASRGCGRVHTLLFGTRVTDVSRHLRDRDVDDALARVGRAVTDWSGGTRIGASLAAFNRRWSRRLLARGAVVLLVTDGLDREGARGIAREAGRLRRSCRRLVWLNPLLRWEGFEPKAAGVRALLGHVDEVRAVHDLASLEALARALEGR